MAKWETGKSYAQAKVIIMILAMSLCLIPVVGCNPDVEMGDDIDSSKPTLYQEHSLNQKTLANTAESLPTNTVGATPSIESGVYPPRLPTLRSPTSTAWMTPMPTLPMEESHSIFKQWLLGTDDCRLPCWAGIVPGDTTINEAKYVVESVLDADDIIEGQTCFSNICTGFIWRLAYPGYLSPVFGDIWGENSNLVTDISVRISTPDFQIPIDQIFIEYGLPDRIMIHAVYLARDNIVSHKIVLSYPKNNFVVRYGRSGWLSGGNIWSCGPFNITELRIAHSPDQNWDKQEILALLDGEFDPELYLPYDELEEVTQFSIESFAEMFINDPNACFEIEKNY